MIPSAVLRDALSIEPYQGHSATGPVFGAAVPAAGMLLSKRGSIALPDGATAQTVAQVLVRPDVAVPLGSRITVAGRAMIVQAIEPQGEFARPFCLRASLGWGAP